MKALRVVSYFAAVAIGVATGVVATDDDPERSNAETVVSPTTAHTTATGPDGDEPRVLAVSPDGRRLLRSVPVDTGRGPHRLISDDVELLQRQTGRVLAPANALHLGQQAFFAGVWLGDRVALSDGRVDGGSSHPRPTVTIIDVSGDRLAGLATWSFVEVEPIFANIDSLQFIDSETITGTVSSPGPVVAHFRCSIGMPACKTT